jgi:hypothetical protein
MEHIYFKHAKSGGVYQLMGNGYLLPWDVLDAPADSDTVYILNGGEKPPYTIGVTPGSRSTDELRECILQLSAGTVLTVETELRLYRSADTGEYYVRPTSEFYDGRFIELDSTMQPVIPLDMKAVAAAAVAEMTAVPNTEGTAVIKPFAPVGEFRGRLDGDPVL